jgi:hypothetical protein
MSTKLLKSVLQRGTNEGSSFVDAAISPSDRRVPHSGKEKKSRKRLKITDDDVPVDKQQLVDATISRLLYLDQSMADIGAKKGEAVERFNRRNQQAKKRQKRSEELILGNSRSSSSKMRLAPERTFNKQRHKKQKEEERLLEIARLLRKDKTIKKTPGKTVVK